MISTVRNAVIALAVFLVTPVAGAAQQPDTLLGAESDIGPLQETLVLEPGIEMRRITLLGSEDHPSLPVDAMQPAAIDEHRAYVQKLRHGGTNVLHFDQVLNSAIAAARADGTFDDWLRTSFPESPDIWNKGDAIDADDLIGRGDYFYHYDAEGEFDPQLLPMKWMFYMRDVATMTNRGLILGNFGNYDRAKEAALVRLAFEHAPELADYSIVFDSEAEDVMLQGGDVVPLDDNTLILGVGNLTEPKAAELIAQRLNIDVLAVSMPPLELRDSGYDLWSGVNLQFLHVDTFFTLVDRNKALAVPFVLEAEYADNNPMFATLLGLARSFLAMLENDPVRHQSRWESALWAIDMLKEIGWVTRYEAGTGAATPLNKKLVDVMRERGYSIIPVGGEQGDLGMDEYLLERVLFELNFQGANVLALGPGEVVAYKENPYTAGALKQAGIKVVDFSGPSLAMWHGGPHCMTLPLKRGDTSMKRLQQMIQSLQ